jgi:hypothetical protein
VHLWELAPLAVLHQRWPFAGWSTKKTGGHHEPSRWPLEMGHSLGSSLWW